MNIYVHTVYVGVYILQNSNKVAGTFALYKYFVYNVFSELVFIVFISKPPVLAFLSV